MRISDWSSDVCSSDLSMESPIEVNISTMPMAVAFGAADWLNLAALHRYPTMKIALSESGIGWIPYLLERADYSTEQHHAWTHSDRSEERRVGTAWVSTGRTRWSPDT